MQLGGRGAVLHDSHRGGIKPNLLATEDTDPHEDTLPVSSSICRQPSPNCTPDTEEHEAAPAARSATSPDPAAGVHGFLWSSGTLCVLAAALIFSVSALLVKLTGNRIPVLQITLVRSSLSWLVGVSLCWQQGITPMFGHKQRLGWLVMRGLSGASAMTTYYVSLLLLPMADAVTLFFLNPILTAILVWLVRGEHLGWLGGAGCLSSFGGLLLLVHPPFLFGGHQDWGYTRSMGVIAGLVSSCLCACAFLCIRMIGKEEPALVVALWFHTATLVVSSLPLSVGWPQKAVLMSGTEWGLLLGVAATSFMGQLLMTRGFQLMPASRASSINMTQVIYSAAFGILVFHEHLTPLGLLGTCLITAGVAAVNAKPAPSPPSLPSGLKQQQQQQDQVLAGQQPVDRAGWWRRLVGARQLGNQPYLPLSNLPEGHCQQQLAAVAASPRSCIPAGQQQQLRWGSFSMSGGSFMEGQDLSHEQQQQQQQGSHWQQQQQQRQEPQWQQQQQQQQQRPRWEAASSHQSVELSCSDVDYLRHRHPAQDGLPTSPPAPSSRRGSLPDVVPPYSSTHPGDVQQPSSRGGQAGHLQQVGGGVGMFVLEEEELETGAVHSKVATVSSR